nr:hypothetical protein [Tanacetum cinerariifolium]
MMSSFLQRQSPSGSGSLPSNTVANSRGYFLAITTQSGVAYDGPTILPTPSPLLKEVPISEPKVALKPNTKPSIPYPSRLNDQNLRETANNQMLKFLKIFQRLHFDISFADALLHMPKFASTFKSLLSNKENLFELANVFVKVGKFYFPADFVVVDYDVDPRDPLILERPFLRITRALIDVHSEELTLRANDVLCKEYAQEVLGFLDSSMSGNPTPSDLIITFSSPSFTPFEGSDFILEEIETFLRTPNELSTLDDDFDPLGDIALIEKLLNKDPSLNLPPMKNEDLKQADVTMTKSLIEEPSELKLKDLPSHLEYTFLEGTDKLPVIISKELKR